MTFSALQRPASLVEEVCRKLAHTARRRVSSGDRKLPPERELARQFKVSRTVVREATKRLELQGLLEVKHGIGIEIVDRLHAPLSGSLALLLPNEKDRLRKLIEVRLIIEPELARLAAERATDADILLLRAHQKRLAQATEPGEAILADMEFHCAIARASRNEVAMLVLHSLSDLLKNSLTLGYGRVTPKTAVTQHAAILEAIAARDAETAAKAMLEHLITAQRDLGLDPAAAKRRVRAATKAA
jgi:GntR family transcriptional repressor for pyruvate dehydrogenase complex